MTHRQAFTKIAEAYSIPPQRRTMAQFWLTHRGLCGAIGHLEIKAPCFAKLNKSRWKWGYWWNYSDDFARCMCALHIAEIGKREFDRLIKEACNG